VEGSVEERAAARRKDDISLSPRAMPMLSGPGSIAGTLGFSSLATSWIDHVAIIIAIMVMAVVTYAVLRLAGRREVHGAHGHERHDPEHELSHHVHRGPVRAERGRDRRPGDPPLRSPLTPGPVLRAEKRWPRTGDATPSAAYNFHTRK